MKTLVAGGAGFIGSHLVERLLSEGKSVVVIDDLSTGTLENLVTGNPRLKIVPSKISKCSELSDLVARAEAIYHLAAAVMRALVENSEVGDQRSEIRGQTSESAP